MKLIHMNGNLNKIKILTAKLAILEGDMAGMADMGFVGCP